MFEISKTMKYIEYTSKEPNGCYELLTKLSKRLDGALSDPYTDMQDVASFGSEAAEIVAEFDEYDYRRKLSNCQTVDDAVKMWMSSCKCSFESPGRQLLLDIGDRKLIILTDSWLSAGLIADANKHEMYSAYILSKFSNEIESIVIQAVASRFM